MYSKLRRIEDSSLTEQQKKQETTLHDHMYTMVFLCILICTL